MEEELSSALGEDDDSVIQSEVEYVTSTKGWEHIVRYVEEEIERLNYAIYRETDYQLVGAYAKQASGMLFVIKDVIRLLTNRD